MFLVVALLRPSIGTLDITTKPKTLMKIKIVRDHFNNIIISI